ncbi:MAG: hypothetical protein PHR35_13385 [Kiritimatiellae bacterium]|nr:hypothetical protein [Kiritimatiellia bacterium]
MRESVRNGLIAAVAAVLVGGYFTQSHHAAWRAFVASKVAAMGAANQSSKRTPTSPVHRASVAGAAAPTSRSARAAPRRSVPTPKPAADPPATRESIQYVEVTVTGDKPETQRQVIGQIAGSSVWCDALRLEQRLARASANKPALHLTLTNAPCAGAAATASVWRIAMLSTNMQGGVQHIPCPAAEDAGGLALAVEDAGLDLLMFRQRDHVLLEQRLMESLDAAVAPLSKELLRRHLATLGNEGFFDARLAALTPVAVATNMAVWEGKDYLVEAGRAYVAREPLWLLFLRDCRQPLHFSIRSEVEIPPKPKNTIVVMPGYSPGTATVRLDLRVGEWLKYSRTVKSGTSSAVMVPQDPYEEAEKSGVHDHLLRASLGFFQKMPRDAQKRQIHFLMEQLGHAAYRDEHHDLLMPVIVDLARSAPDCQDVLVSACGSRLERMGDRCSEAFEAIGPVCTRALLRGLSHRSWKVRSRCATFLRTRARNWLAPYEGEVVKRLSETLRDDDQTNAYAPVLHLLSDLGPAAMPALPAIRYAAEHTTIASDRDLAARVEACIAGG